MNLKAKLASMSGRIERAGQRAVGKVAPLIQPKRDAGAPVHLCHLVSDMELSGDAGQVVNESNHLDPDDFLASCVSVGRRGYLAQRVEPRVQVWSLHRRGPLDRASLTALVRMFRRYKVELVHTHDLDTFVWGAVAARLSGACRVVHTEHRVGVESPAVPDRVRRLARRWCDRFAATSKRAAESLAGALDLDIDDIRIIPRGINSEAFRPPEGRDEARAALGLSPEDLLVGSLARLTPERAAAYRTVLVALATLSGEGMPVRGLLLGEGEARPPLAKEAAELGLTGRVDLPGFSADTAALLPLFDLFVLPFGADGTSTATLEAMSSAVPVVAVHDGGNPELVWDGQSGVLAPPDDAEALAHTLRELLADPERRFELGQNARRQVLEHHRVQPMADRYADLYQDALGPTWEDEGVQERIRRATAGLRGVLT